MMLPVRSLISNESVRQALRQLHSVKALGHCDLSKSALVAHRRQNAGYGDTASGQGLALRELLQRAIQSLAPDDSEPQPNEARWRSYLILYLVYVEQRRSEYLQEYLSISRRTFFTEKKEGLERVTEQLQIWERELTEMETSATSTSPATQTYINLAPPLPNWSLVGRESLLQQLSDLLTDIPPCMALYGLPGVGKTSLLTHLVNQPHVQAQFPDGILWAGMGQTPDNESLLNVWAEALQVPLTKLNQLETLTERATLLHHTIGNRRMLLVLDDVWHSDLGYLLRVGGQGCTHLLTTRQAPIAYDFAGRYAFPLPELDEAASVSLLASLAPEAVAMEQVFASEMVTELGGLPLALVLVGKQIQQQSYGKQSRRIRQAWQALQAVSARLSLSRPQTPAERHPSLPAFQPISLQNIIALSTENLPAKVMQAWSALALLPPKPNTFSEAAALEIVGSLEGVSPVTLDTLVDAGLLEPIAPDRYTMHQLLADFARQSTMLPTYVKNCVAYFADFVFANRNNYAVLAGDYVNIRHAIFLSETELGGKGLEKLLPTMVSFYGRQGLLGEVEAMLGGLAGKDLGAEGNAGISFATGKLHQAREQRDQAIAHYQASLALCQAHGFADITIEIWQRLGEVLARDGDIPASLAAYEAGAKLAEQQQDKLQSAILQQGLGRAHYLKQNYPQARYHGELSLAMAKEINAGNLLGQIYRLLGILHVEAGEYADAKRYYEMALTQYRLQQDWRGQGHVLNNLAVVAKNQMAWDRAGALHQQALQLREKIGDQVDIAQSNLNLGLLYTIQGNYRLGEIHFQQASEIFADTPYKLSLGRVYDNFCHLENCRQNFEKALVYSEKALEIGTEINNNLLVGYTHLNKGETLAGLGRFDEALATYEICLEQWRDYGWAHLTTETLVGMAMAYVEQESYEEARLCVAEIMPFLAKSHTGITKPVQAYLVCFRVLSALGEENAGIFLEKAHTFIQNQLRYIIEPDDQRAFLQDVVENRQVMQLMAG